MRHKKVYKLIQHVKSRDTVGKLSKSISFVCLIQKQQKCLWDIVELLEITWELTLDFN